MTTFTTHKRHILPITAVAFSIAMFNLLQPVKIYAQNVPGLTVTALPPVTANVSFSATDPNPDTPDIPGSDKVIDNNQPSPNFVLANNDNCGQAVTAPYTLTPGANYKCGNIDLYTVQGGENVSCFTPAPVSTAWYSFIADQTTMWIAVKPSNALCGSLAGTIPSSFGLAVYQTATCLPGAPVACLNYYPGNTSVNFWSHFSKLNLTGLSVGTTYLVQIAIYNSCAGNTWKPFCIKIGHPSTCTTCGNICGPICVKSGAGWNTCCTVGQINSVVTTCPGYPLSPPMNMNDSMTNCYSFTAPNDSVYLSFIIYPSCPNGNTFSFTYNLYNSTCGLMWGGNVFANSLVTPLIVGQNYKICYSVVSACSWDSSFYPFVYIGSSVLPVTLASFGAIPQSGKVKIYWSTASEENAKEFIIERTGNGMDFTEIGRVKAAGNSTNMLNYRSYDDNPLVGTNYYRLKQVDYNGEFNYTKLVSVKYFPSAADLGIQPNPAKDNAVITFNTSGNYPVWLKVNSMEGKMILDKHFTAAEGLNEYSLNMSKLPKGIYSVQLIVDDQNMISKLVKE